MSDTPIRDFGLEMPNTPDGLGIPKGLVEDLIVRRMLISRSATVSGIAEGLGLNPAIIREIADELRDRKELEYLGVVGRDYRIGLTSVGEANARERAKVCTYSGTAPVSLQAYVDMIAHQKVKLVVNRENVRHAFGDLVVADELLDQLGPAFMSDGAIFLYGPPGTGKTALAERMIKIYQDQVFVPRTVEIDSQIVIVFDPSVHEAAEPQPPGIDPRWVLCRRPLVMVGGELSAEMMDLQYDEVSGIYSAPIQMKANNGIMVVDDFGRPQLTPTEVLNRWIVPLSRGIDFLRLVSGVRFTIPFELKLIASTNLNPAELGDDAFLRRLRNKVFVGPITDNAFNWILVRVAKAKGIEVGSAEAAHLRVVAMHHLGELRPYVAVDFCDLMIGICEYEGFPRHLTIEMIDRVASVYFLEDHKEVKPEEPSKSRLGTHPTSDARAELATAALSRPDTQLGHAPTSRPLPGHSPELQHQRRVDDLPLPGYPEPSRPVGTVSPNRTASATSTTQ